MNEKKQIYYKYFEDKILPSVQNVEKYRIKLIKKVILSSLLFFIAGAFFAYIFIIIMLNDKFNPLLFPLVLFCMYAFIIKGIINFILRLLQILSPGRKIPIPKPYWIHSFFIILILRRMKRVFSDFTAVQIL